MPRWIDTLQHEAERALAPEVADYYRVGAGAGISVAEAPAAWDAVRFRPHVLRDVTTVSTRVSVLGTDLASPVLVASSTLQMQAHPDGEVAMAAGTREAGSLLVVSSNAGRTFADVGRAGSPWWVQAYVLADRDLTGEMLDAAVAAGARAVVLTVDTPVVGTKRWQGADVWDVVPVEHTMGNWARTGGRRDPNAKARDLTVADIAWTAQRCGVPVVVKGVLRGDDARAAVDAGAAGVIVSNHGGRQLDQAVPTAVALPEVADALAGTGAFVGVDGGIRSGAGVLAALCLGAHAVFLGRPALWALTVGGPAGVTRLIGDLTAELAEGMTLCGATSVAELTRDLVAGGPDIPLTHR